MTNTNFLKLLLIIFPIAFLFSCQKSVDIKPALEQKAYVDVEEDLWYLFSKFEKEAKKRGKNIDLSSAGITGSIEHINTSGMVGLCNHRSDEPNHVIIDADFWRMANNELKELIVFHELGHCFLKRGHTDEKHNNGICRSIMRSGQGGCIDSYTPNTRTDYLDELYFYEQ